LAGEGEGQSATGTVVDKAGNSASTTVSGIKIDLTPPITTITIGPPNTVVGSTTYVSVSTPFSLGVTENLAGPDQTKYGIDAPSTPSSYTGSFTIPSPGTHTIYYRSTDKAGNQETTKPLTVVVGATTLTYSGDTAGQYSDPITLKATLIELASGKAIQDKTITFTIGTQSTTGATDSSGIAAASLVLNQPASGPGVTASFAGDSAFQGSSDGKSFTINKETVVITYTGDTFVFTAGPTISTAPVRLSASLVQDPDGSLGNLVFAKVRFELFKGGNLAGTADFVVGNVPVSADGVAITTWTLGVDVWNVVVKIEPANGYWTQSEVGEGVLTVDYGSTVKRVTGGGWIPDSQSANGKGNFGFTVNYQKTGSPKGNFLYLFRGTDGYNYLVKSNSWQGGGLSFTGTNKAYFSGKCVVQKINRATGQVETSSGNYRFTVDITDGDLTNPRTSDKFAITIFTSTGAIWRQIGTAAVQIPLGGGNVTIHSK
jgi:hypothetical protein